MSSEEADDSSVEPLPQVVREWALSGLTRPSKLPECYDPRIADSGIFVVPVHPISGVPGPCYVVPKGCTHCVGRLRQRCDRGLPVCGRCTTSRPCDVGRQGWEFLPREKIVKQGYLSVKKVTSKCSPNQNAACASASAASAATSGIDVRRPSRLAAPKPGTLNLRVLSGLASDEDETRLRTRPSNTLIEQSKSNVVAQGTKERLVTQEPVPTISSFKLLATDNARQDYVKKKLGKQVQEVKKRKPGRPPREGNRTKPKLKSLKTKFRLAELNAVKSRWKPVRPPPASSSQTLTSGVSSQAFGKPRIWTTSKEDLLEVFPALANELACKQSEAPMLLIQGASWPEDSWKNDMIIFSMVRECIVPTIDQVVQSVPPAVVPPAVPDPDQTLFHTEDANATMVEPDEPMNIIDKDAALALGLPGNIAYDLPFEHYDYLRPHDTYPDNALPNFVSPISGGPHSGPIVGPYGEYRNGTALNVTPPCFKNSHFISEDGQFFLPQPSLSRSTGLTGAFALPKELRTSFTGIRFSHSHDTVPDVMGYPSSSNRLQGSSEIVNDVRSHERYLEPGLGGAANYMTRGVSWPSTSSDSEAPPSLYSTNACPTTIPKRMLPPSPSMLRTPSCGNETTFAPSDTPDSVDTPITNNTPSLVDEQRVEDLVYPDEPVNTRDPSENSDTIQQDLGMEPLVPQDKVNSEIVPVLPTPLPIAPPDDVQALLDAKESQFPVNLVLSRDSALLPFVLPEDYGCVFLGFFEIRETKCTVVEAQPDGSGNTRYTARWTFTFVWIAGGELDYSLPQPSTPWWTGPIPSSEDGVMIQHSFSVLPPLFTLQQQSSPGAESITVSEPIIRKGWHCGGCGKVNVQRYFSFQRCSTCQAPNGMSPVDAFYIRDPHHTASITFPSDRYPPSVASIRLKNGETGMRTFVYSVRAHIAVEHFFTCNEKHLQQDANSLFKEFQMGVKLEWQGAKTMLAAGPYFTYLAGSNHEQGHTSEAWDAVPTCVTTSRKIVEDLIHEQLENLTVLAWYAPGNRKSPTPLPAKHHSITILNLGADVELKLYPSSGFPDKVGVSEPLTKPRLPLSASDQLMYLEDDSDHVMVDEEDDVATAGLLYEAHKTEEEQVVRAAVQEPTKEIMSGKTKAKKRDRGEDIFITMVHGDVLRLSGDDFEWSMKRTGMSVVMIGVTAPKPRLG